jgi:predicted nucleic acid-binding protein
VPRYLDSSALVKLVLAEPETEALRRHLGDDAAVVSALAQAELIRTVRRVRPALERSAIELLSTFTLLDVDAGVLTAAGQIAPPGLRTLDAIHLASALTLGAELDAVVTYDTRMIEAARAAGLRVESPE